MKIVRKRMLPRYFDKAVLGLKNFEICKDDDSIQVGDELIFDEFNGWEYTGRHMQYRVTYVVRNCPECGLEDDYCILGIYPVSQSLWYDVRSTAPSYLGWFVVHVDDSHEPPDERIWGRDDIVVPAIYDEGQWLAYLGGEEHDLTEIVMHWMELPEAPEAPEA